MIKIIGLDLSTKTGISFVDHDSKTNTLTYRSELIKCGYTPSTRNEELSRLKTLVETAIKHINEYNPNLVVVENYSYSSKFVSFTAIEINSAVQYNLYINQIPYILVPPTTLKKFVTGVGNSKKDMMRLEAYKLWGIEAKTDDEVDAISLAMLGMAHLGRLTGLPKANLEAIKGTKLEVIKAYTVFKKQNKFDKE
jgi:crossover junction endodeoxyribonuclease RuvC